MSVAWLGGAAAAQQAMFPQKCLCGVDARNEESETPIVSLADAADVLALLESINADELIVLHIEDDSDSVNLKGSYPASDLFDKGFLPAHNPFLVPGSWLSFRTERVRAAKEILMVEDETVKWARIIQSSYSCEAPRHQQRKLPRIVSLNRECLSHPLLRDKTYTRNSVYLSLAKHYQEQVSIVSSPTTQLCSYTTVVKDKLYLSDEDTALSLCQKEQTDVRITHVLSLGVDSVKLEVAREERFREVQVLHLKVLDDGVQSLSPHFSDGVRFIDGALENGNRDCRCLVYCRMGASRSPIMVAAFLVARYGMSPVSALLKVSAQRRELVQICPTPKLLEDLFDWARALGVESEWTFVELYEFLRKL